MGFHHQSGVRTKVYTIPGLERIREAADVGSVSGVSGLCPLLVLPDTAAAATGHWGIGVSIARK